MPLASGVDTEKTPSKTRRPDAADAGGHGAPGSHAAVPIPHHHDHWDFHACRSTTIPLPDRHRVTVLGSFSVTATAPVPLGSDVGRLVAYLAVHRGPQRRADVAGDVWPGLTAALARHLLVEALASVDAVAAAAGLLDTGPLALHPDVSVDLDEAMALVRELAGAPGRAPDDPLRRCGPPTGRHPARLDRGVAGRRAGAVPADPAQRARGAQRRAERAWPARRGRRARRGGGAHGAQPGQRPPRAHRGPPRPGRNRRGGGAVRRVPGAAAMQRRCAERIRPGRAAAARPGLAGSAGASADAAHDAAVALARTGRARRFVSGGSTPGTTR